MGRTQRIAMMLFVFVSFMLLTVTTSFSEETGETLFKKFCAVCHVNGDNVITPSKSLHKKTLDENNVKTEEDVLKIMRNPGPGMTRFSEKVLNDAAARKIAAYVLSAFP